VVAVAAGACDPLADRLRLVGVGLVGVGRFQGSWRHRAGAARLRTVHARQRCSEPPRPGRPARRRFPPAASAGHARRPPLTDRSAADGL